MKINTGKCLQRQPPCCATPARTYEHPRWRAERTLGSWLLHWKQTCSQACRQGSCRCDTTPQLPSAAQGTTALRLGCLKFIYKMRSAQINTRSRKNTFQLLRKWVSNINGYKFPISFSFIDETDASQNLDLQNFATFGDLKIQKMFLA